MNHSLRAALAVSAICLVPFAAAMGQTPLAAPSVAAETPSTAPTQPDLSVPPAADEKATPMTLEAPHTLAPRQLSRPQALTHGQQEPATAGADQAPAPETKSKSGFVVDQLTTISADSFGVLTDYDGGLGHGMWQGTPRSLADTLMNAIPEDSPSPVLRRLMKRLLLTGAEVPQGMADEGTFLVTRLNKLTAMGDTYSVAQMMENAPPSSAVSGLKRIEANNLFLAGDTTSACQIVQNKITENLDNYWQKALIFCRALSGQKQQAALGANLLFETGDKDSTFFSLSDALISGTPLILDTLPEVRPLHLAMIRATKTQLPARLLNSSNPSVLSTLASNPGTPASLRLDATMKAEATGALPTEYLRQVFREVAFDGPTRNNALSEAENLQGAERQALLFQTAESQTLPAAQAQVVAKALELARNDASFVTASRVYQPQLEAVPANADLEWFSNTAFRGLLAANRHDLAGNWYSVIFNAALVDPKAKENAADIMPLAHIAGLAGIEANLDQDIENWWLKQGQTPERLQRAATMFTLLEGLGQPVNQGFWNRLLVGPQRETIKSPRPAITFGLERAVDGNRLAETVGFVLMGMGSARPVDTDPMFLRTVLHSLRTLGLEEDARALAVEVALNAGI